jgi:hypothetical protein
MYTIAPVVRRDVARHFQIASLPAREQVDQLVELVKKAVEAEMPHDILDRSNVERSLKLEGWIIAPDSHPGYDWDCGVSQRDRVTELINRTLPVVGMMFRFDHAPWWFMVDPEERGPAADLVREILADCEEIEKTGQVMTMVPGPAPDPVSQKNQTPTGA